MYLSTVSIYSTYLPGVVFIYLEYDSSIHPFISTLQERGRSRILRIHSVHGNQAGGSRSKSHRHRSALLLLQHQPTNQPTWASSRGSSSSSKATTDDFFLPVLLPMFPSDSSGSAKERAPREEPPPPGCAPSIGGSGILGVLHSTHVTGYKMVWRG